MPREYLIFTTFGYEDTFPKNSVAGSANVYINGSFAGSEVYTEMLQMSKNGIANISKLINI